MLFWLDEYWKLNANDANLLPLLLYYNGVCGCQKVIDIFLLMPSQL